MLVFLHVLSVFCEFRFTVAQSDMSSHNIKTPCVCLVLYIYSHTIKDYSMHVVILIKVYFVVKAA